MKLLILSDSHSALRLMYQFIDSVKPDAVIHLGDYYEDAASVAADYHRIPFYMVPGNCDRFRRGADEPEILVREFAGVRFYMTHGHRHKVKVYTDGLILDARAAGAQVALYGHTHCADCREVDGLWVLNPGSCGYGGGTAGIIEVADKKILSCRVVRYDSLEGSV